MVFNSLTFLVFLAVVLAVDALPLSWRTRKTHLLLASYAFYAAWNPPFVALLWLSTAVDWIAARRMAESTGRGRRRAWLLLSLGTNLGLLAVFKYGDFLLENTVSLLALAGVRYAPPELDVILPVGISFYTFQTLSYSIDVYRGSARPWGSLLDFALFVTFFPQLVAGPIVRAVDFLPQCVEPRRASGDQRGWGLTLLALGLVQKTWLADGLLAPVADHVFARGASLGSIDAWLGTLAFSAQIFFDFSGYSLCAIGVALCLGFRLPDNFRFPYAAVGFSDFWRRWHISLSTWLRDYLYIPLGGNRGGPASTQRNLMLTMLLGGLWHGASWNFVVWGGLHGTYLVVERWLRQRLGRPFVPAFALALATYALVCVTWVFFRAPDLSTSLSICARMLVPTGGSGLLSGGDRAMVAAVTIGLLGTQWLLRDASVEDLWRRFPPWARAALLAFLLLSLALVRGDDRAFIYFQF